MPNTLFIVSISSKKVATELSTERMTGYHKSQPSNRFTELFTG